MSVKRYGRSPGTPRGKFLTALRKSANRGVAPILINKTASTSVARALGFPRQHHFDCRQWIRAVGSEAWDGCLSFAIVRNPFDRAVSIWSYRRRIRRVPKGMGFDEWVRAVWVEGRKRIASHRGFLGPQRDWIVDENDRVIVDYVGRFDDLQASWDEICRRLQRNPSDLNVSNGSSHLPWREMYTDPETARIVAGAMAPDLETWDWELPPGFS